MRRRDFLAGSLAAGAAAGLSPAASGRTAEESRRPAAGQFKLKYAPSLGQFKNLAGKDLKAQIQFAADQGFGAMFDNGLMDRPPADQELIGRELAERSMTLGPFVLYADFGVKSFVTRDKDTREMLLKKMRQGVETLASGPTAPRLSSSRGGSTRAWPGTTRPPTSSTTSGLHGGLRARRSRPGARAAQPEEPPGLFLTKIPQAYEICRAVDSPSCKILERHLPPADHRGESHPQHRRGLGRDRRLPLRRQSRPEGADDRRDQLPERLQAPPRQGLPGRAVHGARPEQARQGGRAGRDRRLSGL